MAERLMGAGMSMKAGSKSSLGIELLVLWWCSTGPVVAQELDSSTALSAADGTALFSGIALALVVAAVMIAWRALDARAAFEREVELRKAQLDTAVDHMSQGLVMFDAQARVALLNNRYIEMYGLSPAVAKPGLTFRELLQHRKDCGAFAGDVDAYHVAVVQSLSGSSHPPVLTEPMPGRFFNVVNRPIPCGGWVATHDDVTERQIMLAAQAAAEDIAQQQRIQLETALNNMTHGLVMYDAEGRVVLFNRQYATFLGLDPDRVLGRSLLEILHEGRAKGNRQFDPETFCAEMLAAAARGESRTEEFETGGRLLRVTDEPMPGGGWVATFEDITERESLRAAQAAAEGLAQQKKIQLEAALDNMTQGLSLYDKDGRVILFNRRYSSILGHDPNRILGRSLRDLLHESKARGANYGDPDEYFEEMLAYAARGESRTRIFEANGRLLRAVDQPMPGGGWIVTFEDITESTRIEAERDRDREFLKMIVDNVPSTIYVKSAHDRKFVLVNRVGEMLWARPGSTMIGKTAADLFPPEEAAYIHQREDELLARGQPVCDERDLLTATQGIRTVYSRRIAIQDKNGDKAYILGVIDDITERRAADARIAHLAHYDSLTGLPNRTLFNEQLQRRLAALAPHERLAVLYLDLDNFKSVNDTLGHATGDDLLRAVAKRLKSNLDEDDLLSRLSGDEFAIVLSDVTSLEDACARARLLRRSVIDRVLDLNGHKAVTDLSVGIALAPDHGSAVGDLLKHADLALNSAKLDGRATCRHFEPEMNARMTLRRDLEMDLRRAITGDQLEVHYQPVVTLQGDRITGCEALVRWRHPTKGMISPVEFIPVAEDTGLISAIGERVLWQACSDAARWPDDKKVAVNVSPVQLRNPEFPKTVERCLKQTGLPARRLELEMTESVLMQNTEATLETLRKLQQTGVGISLDDFGTGYSSLSYLRRFPFNRIKIDRSFVTDIAARPDALAIVRTILMLAESLGMTSTAEGVETDDQKTLLKAIGCHEMQGYLFSRAVPPEAALRLLQDGAAKDTAAA